MGGNKLITWSLIVIALFFKELHVLLDYGIKLDLFYVIDKKEWIQWIGYDIGEFTFKGIIIYIAIKHSAGLFYKRLFIWVFCINAIEFICYFLWSNEFWLETFIWILIIVLYIITETKWVKK